MRKPFALLLIGLFFGTGLGFMLAAANGITLDGHDHNTSAEAMTDHGHDHGKMIVLPAGDNAPTIKIALHPDAVAGWNLEIITDNFTFTPENVNQAPVAGEGHAHVYVNGEKLARLYAPWVHIGTLPKGETTVTVSLNANDHSPLSVGDTPLSADAIIQVP
jgi:uncharacterized Zn-binding protein involved in type VI secretion